MQGVDAGVDAHPPRSGSVSPSIRAGRGIGKTWTQPSIPSTIEEEQSSHPTSNPFPANQAALERNQTEDLLSSSMPGSIQSKLQTALDEQSALNNVPDNLSILAEATQLRPDEADVEQNNTVSGTDMTTNIAPSEILDSKSKRTNEESDINEETVKNENLKHAQMRKEVMEGIWPVVDEIGKLSKKTGASHQSILNVLRSIKKGVEVRLVRFTTATIPLPEDQ
jgi:hypothetical protein